MEGRVTVNTWCGGVDGGDPIPRSHSAASEDGKSARHARSSALLETEGLLRPRGKKKAAEGWKGGDRLCPRLRWSQRAENEEVWEHVREEAKLNEQKGKGDSSEEGVDQATPLD